MKRSGEESQGGNIDIFTDEVSYPRLNLPLTKSQELINLIESHLKEHYPCRPQQKLPPLTEKSIKTSIPPKSHEKLKAINFPVAKITIGRWTNAAVNPHDIVAKFYFAKKKLIWEFLDSEAGTNMVRLKRKIEIQWDDVLSLQTSIHSRDETGILDVELRKRPTFFIETNPQAGKHTQWKQMEDFTQDQSSICRIHTLHFEPGILQKNLEKLVSGDSFWSELIKVSFPLHESIYFDIDYVSNSHDNSSCYASSHTLNFGVNSDPLHHHSQGIRHAGVGEGNLNMATQFWDFDGMQLKSCGQANTADEFLGTQAIPQSSQVFNEQYNMGGYIAGSQISMIQDESQMQNTIESLGNQAHALPDTQFTNVTFHHMNYFSVSPVPGSYLADTILQEEERQRMEHTPLDGNFQINGYQQNDDDCDPRISSNNWQVFPHMNIGDDSNSEDKQDILTY